MTEQAGYAVKTLPTGKVYLSCSGVMCHRAMTHKTLEDAVLDWTNHKCPWGSGTKVAWSVAKTLVEQMWEKLDYEIDQIAGYRTSDGKMAFAIDSNYNKARARAFCEAIALFMVPFFNNADEVGREAMRRHGARMAGETEYETKGIGHRRYESALDEKQRTVAPPKAPPAIPHGEAEAMKKSYEAMPTVFTAEVLAQQYKRPLSAVKALLADS
jgi:hypothetical protein